MFYSGVAKKFSKSQGMNSSAADNRTIDQMLQAINSALNSAPKIETRNRWGNTDNGVGIPMGWSSDYSGAHNIHGNSSNIDFDVTIGSESWTPFNRTVPQMTESRPYKLQSHSPRTNTPFWEQQAPFNTMTLPDVFKLLESDDPDCIICVKKIHKLGFKAVKFLRQYLSQFGVITRIVVLPSRQKEVATPYGSSVCTVRPASMCFVVMSSRLACRRILMQELHYVAGDWPVEVSIFNQQPSNETRASSFEGSTTSSY